MSNASTYDKTSTADGIRQHHNASFFKPVIQSKLTIDQPGDEYELEADAMADKVMRFADNESRQTFFEPAISFIQRKCAHCEEEEKKMQRKENSGENITPSLKTENYISSLAGKGRSLTESEKSFFEPKFGYDFSNVQLHTNSEANQSAKSINAFAYTHGNHIVFGANQYQPDTNTGKNLLAHELTHTIQQNAIRTKRIQRCADAATDTQFDTVAGQVRTRTEYTSLPPGDRTVADEIITIARGRDDCMHFIDRLLILFQTPVDQSPAVGAAASGIMATAAQEERDRLATPEGVRLRDLEERTAADPSHHLVTIPAPAGSDGAGTNFRIDRSDVNNIIVQVKIRVTGNATDVSNIEAQEDGIEKAAQQMGYILDVIFVHTNGSDVFNVSINPAAAVTSRNWSAYSTNPVAYVHEIHHLLGLDDRYDYTSHARNRRMNLQDRLHWFRVQVGRPFDPHIDESVMGRGQQLLDDDICHVTQLNFATCMSTRQTQRDALNTARLSAFSKSFSIFQSLANISPSSPVPYGDEMRDLRRRQIISKANLIFGTDVDEDQLLDIITTIRNRLMPGITMRFAPSTDSNCTGNSHYILDMRPPIVVCSNFFSLNADEQAKSYLRAAAQLARVDNSIRVNSSGAYDCTTASAGFNDADAWAKFVWCASSV